MILKQLKYGAGILALLGITACTHEDAISVTPSEEQETILSALKSHIITRAGDEVTQFEVGTKYLLYANRGNEWPLYNTEGTEQANHTIGYGSPLVYDDTPISIYGVTYGTPDSPNKAPENTPLGVPMIAEKVTNNSLPDLMFSNNLISQRVENGYRLEMDFKHAMSKVEFMIVKQDESKDDEKKLENVTLKNITVKGTYQSGTLDIVNEKWNYGDSDELVERNYFSGEQDITTTSTKVSGELLLFPNADNEEVSISVTLGNLEGGDKTVTYPLRKVNEEGEDAGAFQFEVNHQYTLLITVLKDEVRTIAIAPQVYDWIDENRDDNYLGQPVTFANLMWMDRNLGAKSADCENDWENCRGYYYQYARNIPYILDKEKYDAAPNKIPVYPFLYTYNQYGEKVYSVDDVQTTVLTSQTIRGRKKIAVNPGEDGEYRFISDVNNGGYWMLDENGQEESFINEFWTSSVENHPCPKGWRLPTKEDFASFMPDITLNAPWSKGFNSRIYIGAVLGNREQLVYGEIGDEKAMYLIKRQGHPDCYRIRILMKESKESGKWYFEFAYFSGDPTMTFVDLTTEEKFLESMTNGRFDWSTPTAIMEVPACGFIHPSTENRLNGDGINALLRADEPNEQYNWICYLRDDAYQFGLIKTSRKALGDQIRCVRDVTAK
ncbi:MAG TPA: fimbrillin family protein [Candidatus Bacteroides merdavium]|uniref:Fimbrillin family protein n=1 Tax=Candidatus Bacteroides merdavium TaxID=2838472 RepID=A0A9D2GZQ0_9BACE|nr:fimbrillin family protein [Candidatus Bacteroides merdavium]